MKKIKIKSMALTNFKGIRSMSVDFGQNLTKITGRNGSGKTTIFDAFTWVLFGKDSHDRKTFDIKTIGADGKPIARLPHEVTLLLDVDGEEIKLTPIEFEILFLLASHPGKVFSTDEIFEKVWDEKVYEANNTVMVHIRRLRGKLREESRENKIISTVWGIGYKIEK